MKVYLDIEKSAKPLWGHPNKETFLVDENSFKTDDINKNGYYLFI